MVICTIMRMLLGMYSRISATNKPDRPVTAITAMHMVTVVDILFVTANAEQMPRICNAIGLLEKMGVVRTFNALDWAMILSPCLIGEIKDNTNSNCPVNYSRSETWSPPLVIFLMNG